MMKHVNQNRFAVLNDIAELFESKGIDVIPIINALSYASFCILTFEFGEINVELTIDSTFCTLTDNNNNKTATLSIEFNEKSMEYVYNVKKLRELIKSWKSNHSSSERSYL